MSILREMKVSKWNRKSYFGIRNLGKHFLKIRKWETFSKTRKSGKHFFLVRKIGEIGKQTFAIFREIRGIFFKDEKCVRLCEKSSFSKIGWGDLKICESQAQFVRKGQKSGKIWDFQAKVLLITLGKLKLGIYHILAI